MLFELKVEEILQRLPYLESMNLKGCPVTKSRKYRDRIVLSGLKILHLDGKPVRDEERLFLIKMKKNTLKKKLECLK